MSGQGEHDRLCPAVEGDCQCELIARVRDEQISRDCERLSSSESIDREQIAGDEELYGHQPTWINLEQALLALRQQDPGQDRGQDGQIRLSVDKEGHAILLASLDLYQRVAMGQWSEVARVSWHLLDDEQQRMFSPVEDDLMAVRCRWAKDPALSQWPNASMGVAQSGDGARGAYDLWHALGGGMPSRQDMRLSRLRIHVER